MIRNEYAVALLWTGPSEVGQVKIVAHFCSFVLIPLLRPALCREGPPQTPCRHRPAYAVDPRRRKGRVSRGGGGGVMLSGAQRSRSISQGPFVVSLSNHAHSCHSHRRFPHHSPRRRESRSPVVLPGTFWAIVGHFTPVTPTLGRGSPTDAGLRRRCAFTDQRTRPGRNRERRGCRRRADRLGGRVQTIDRLRTQ